MIGLHSDKRREGVEWCKKNFSTQRWHTQKFTDVYQDTFYFETEVQRNLFVNAFMEWVSSVSSKRVVCPTCNGEGLVDG